MAGGKDPGFILYVLFIIVMGGIGMVKNALQQKAKAEQRRRGALPRSPEDEWGGLEMGSPDPGQSPQAATKPSAKVEAILRELERQEQAKAPPPVPRETVSQTVESGAGGSMPVKRRYLNEEGLRTLHDSPSCGLRANKTERELMGEALSTAFPAGVKQARRACSPQARPVVVNAMGRRNVRQGILFAEALGRPRAFDL